MDGKEITRRAIEFDRPPRLPLFLGEYWSSRLPVLIEDFPNDVWDSWEIGRQQHGWFS